ncbi:MAG: hypothetical protein RLZZ86_4025, partial [Cyanobacteriota bacterium]
GDRLQVTGYRLQVTGYRLQVTGYRLQVTGATPRGQKLITHYPLPIGQLFFFDGGFCLMD